MHGRPHHASVMSSPQPVGEYVPSGEFGHAITDIVGVAEGRLDDRSILFPPLEHSAGQQLPRTGCMVVYITVSIGINTRMCMLA